MTPRAILRDPDILFGRWRFDGTKIAVAEVRAAYNADPQSAIAAFQRQGLTREDINSALAFAFPDVRSLSISQNYGSVTVHCVCGEDTSATLHQPTCAIVQCPCGRRWRIVVNVVPVAD
jgi:uncharacterized protein (DUF433 family)